MAERRRNDQKTSRSSSSFRTIFRISEKNQEIPAGFVRNVLKDHVPDSFILECATGGPWPVEVFRSKNGVFFRNGWRKLVEEKSLQDLDVILYTYRGGLRLFFQIFAKSGLEITTSVKKRAREEEEEAVVISKEERARIFKSRSKHYMFERVMKEYNVNVPFILYIPQDFGEAHLLPYKTKVTVTNAEGKSWKVNCTSKKSINFRFVGGWGSFVTDNDLKIGDICVFELVAKYTLRVHVFSDLAD